MQLISVPLCHHLIVMHMDHAVATHIDLSLCQQLLLNVNTSVNFRLCVK